MKSLNLKNSLLASSAGILAVFLWSAIPALVKLGTTSQALSFVILLRFLISSLLFTPLLPQILQNAKKISLKALLILAITLSANYYFQGLAMQSLPASWYIVIFSLNPLLALAAIGVKLNRKILLAAFISIIGTFLFINAGGGWSAPISSIFYILIGMLTWVGYTMLVKKLQTQLSDLEVTGVTQILALFGTLIIWLGTGLPTAQLQTQDLTSIIILGFSTPLAYFAFSYCMRRAPVFGIVSQYLEPIFGVIIGMMIFGESISWFQAIGAALIVWGTSRVSY